MRSFVSGVSYLKKKAILQLPDFFLQVSEPDGVQVVQGNASCGHRNCNFRYRFREDKEELPKDKECIVGHSQKTHRCQQKCFKFAADKTKTRFYFDCLVYFAALLGVLAVEDVFKIKIIVKDLKSTNTNNTIKYDEVDCGTDYYEKMNKVLSAYERQNIGQGRTKSFNIHPKDEIMCIKFIDIHNRCIDNGIGRELSDY